METTTKLRVYGRRAGNPKGNPENPERCIVEVHAPGRGIHFHQCLRKRGFGPNSQYCKQHDPDAAAAREDTRKAEHRAQMNRLDEAGQDRRVGSWIRRYKPEDYKDITELLYGRQ